MRNKEIHRHSLRAKMIGINVGIALTSFLLCGLLFIVSVEFLVGKYVNQDLDFFLTEMSDNLNTKMSFLEDVIYGIRDSEELMDYLENPGDRGAAKRERLLQLFRKEVNISSAKNQSDQKGPLVDKVYLYDTEGGFYSSFYYALVDSQIEYADQAFAQIHEQMEGEYQCRDLDGRTYIAYTLLDNNMDRCGTVIYDLNREAVQSVMEGVRGYEESFWIVYDHSRTVAGDAEVVPAGVMELLQDEMHYEPFTAPVRGSSYRLYQERMCLNLSVALGIPENQALLVLYDSIKIYVLGIIIVLLGGLISFILFTYRMTKPIKEVTEKMVQVQKGDFETKLPDYNNREFHEISTVFNEMTEYINHLIKEVYEKQITIKEMEIKFLQTQMNPHFMFNVLNAIALQARMDGNEEVFKMVSSFARLIQAKIYRNKEEKVKIRQELEYVEYYLYLQRFRYGDHLQYHIESEREQLLEMYIPKLCMQLIVENAVVHGIEPKPEPGLVEIKLYEEDASIYIDISDNGVGFDRDGEVKLPIEMETEDRSHNHVGLNNANHIIRLLYGEKYGIKVYSRQGEGTMVRIHIPLDRGDKEGNDAV